MFGHSLLFYALNAIITMSLKLFLKIEISFNLEDLIDNNFVVALELSLVASIVRRELCEILNGFLSFFQKKKKPHNMLSLMLYPRFKSLRLVSSLIAQEHHVSIVEEYDQ